MNAVEIIMLIIGFACICASVFIAKKHQKEETGSENEISIDNVWSEKEEKIIYDRVSEILTNYQEELIESTNDQMNYMSNEKIMAIDEFSRQVVEKIENEHQEVIFMYNMLNEKEKEIKDIISNPIEVSTITKEEAIKPAPLPNVTNEKMQVEIVADEEDDDSSDFIKIIGKKNNNSSYTASDSLNENTDSSSTNNLNSNDEIYNVNGTAKTALERLKSIQKSTIKELKEEENRNKTKTKAASQTEKLKNAKKKNELEKKKSKKSKAESEKEAVSKISGSVNMQIQKMYKEGKSILDISKELNIGQGEVKLVIALYGGRKRN